MFDVVYRCRTGHGKIGRASPCSPSGNEMRREIAKRCGGSVCATTCPTSSRSVIVYADSSGGSGGARVVRRFDGLVGYDKEVLRQVLDLIVEKGK